MRRVLGVNTAGGRNADGAAITAYACVPRLTSQRANFLVAARVAMNDGDVRRSLSPSPLPASCMPPLCATILEPCLPHSACRHTQAVSI